MRSGTLTAALLCGGLFAMTARADNVDGASLPPADYAGKLTGTLNSDGSFSMRVELDHAVVNPGQVGAANNELRDVIRDQERIDRIQVDMARTKDPKHYVQLQRDLADAVGWMQIHAARAQVHTAEGVRIIKDYKDVDFHTADGVKIRMLNPPAQFDDKGNPKQYTKDELKALKGADKDLPGYEATADSLKNGAVVKVTLSAPKASKKDDKDSKKDADAKPGNQVTLILIIAGPSDDSPKK